MASECGDRPVSDPAGQPGDVFQAGEVQSISMETWSSVTVLNISVGIPLPT